MDKTYLVERKDFNNKIPALQTYLTFAGELLTVGAIKADKGQYIGFTLWIDSDYAEIFIDTDDKAKFITEKFSGRWAE